MSKSLLQEQYEKKVVPALKEQFQYKNHMAVPKVMKVVVHIGIGAGLKDAKVLETAEATIKRITGQQPVKTKAKKSIANFKIREGMVVGLKVTLRGKRMWDFLTKFLTVALPRIRDFRGIKPTIVDDNGNASIGLKEHLAFPEISSDEVERLHGLEVTVHTTAGNRAAGQALLTGLGFPFTNS